MYLSYSSFSLRIPSSPSPSPLLLLFPSTISFSSQLKRSCGQFVVKKFPYSLLAEWTLVSCRFIVPRSSISNLLRSQVNVSMMLCIVSQFIVPRSSASNVQRSRSNVSMVMCIMLQFIVPRSSTSNLQRSHANVGMVLCIVLWFMVPRSSTSNLQRSQTNVSLVLSTAVYHLQVSGVDLVGNEFYLTDLTLHPNQVKSTGRKTVLWNI